MKINGIGVSNGIVISKVFKLETVELIILDEKIINSDKEIEKLNEAIASSVQELKVIRERTAIKIDEEHAMIFDAHIQLATDPEIFNQVKDMINSNKMNAAYSLNSVSEMFAQVFENMDNEYMKERAVDVRDVSRRIIAKLLGIELSDTNAINEEVIVVANDLTPSDTAQLDKNFVKGFITNIGGRTSHSAIMARSLEIPAIVGTKNIMDHVKTDDFIILDGIDGIITINPTDKEISDSKLKNQKYLEQVKLSLEFINKPSITVDGKKVELAANIGSPEDIDRVINNGGEGIGLYRTEFLYMNNDNFPTEDEQYIAYKIVLESFKENKVVIRTLDIGGDKHLDYLSMDEELNPFLGYRALRLCLDRTDIFKTQLRALLRASIHGNLHIMFPMVATLGELRSAKEILEVCKKELLEESIDFSKNIKVGIMVEIPAVAILADQFAKEVDFFSIGTNDLIQYTFAADRMNEKVAYLYQPYNPSLLRLIKIVIDASHKEGIWTGMCGEMAGDEIAAPILLGLGLDEFSMSASSILKTRQSFSYLEYKDMKKMAEECLLLATNEEVKEFVKKTLRGEKL